MGTRLDWYARVVAGSSDATSVEVTDGLKEGDLVVTDLPALLVRP